MIEEKSIESLERLAKLKEIRDQAISLGEQELYHNTMREIWCEQFGSYPADCLRFELPLV